MDCEFIQEIQTWGSGGHMMDIAVLKDGRILVIAEFGIFLYDDWETFHSGGKRTAIQCCPQNK